jgi:hypothetical protein
MMFVAALLLATPPATPTPAATSTPASVVLRAKEGAATAPPAVDSLAAAAKRIKLRLPTDHPRVITNETVKQLSEGVELTTSKSVPPQGPGAPTGAAHGSIDSRRTMWQQRYVNAVVNVSRLEAKIKWLQSEVNRLQTVFYATDDPARRDGVLKPAWDRALADLKEAQAELEQARGEPDRVLDDARRDGALPGWFRGLDDQIRERASEPTAGEPHDLPPAAPTRPRSVTPG